MKRKHCRDIERISARAMWDSAEMNQISYDIYLNLLLEIALSRVKYEGLPDSVDPRYLELQLITNGSAIYFHDEVLGDLCLGNMSGGKWDIYNVPTTRRAYAANGYQKQLDEKNSIIIFNNMLHTPDLLGMRLFATRLAQLDRVIDVNVSAQKTPVVICASEQQRLSMLQLYKKYEGNEPFIFGNKNLNLEDVKTLKTDAPYVADKIHRLKCNLYNDCLSSLGVTNAAVNKAERVNAAEISAGMGGTFAIRNSLMNARKQAVEQINKMFDQNITVEWNNDNVWANELTGGENKDGKIYGNGGGIVQDNRGGEVLS